MRKPKKYFSANQRNCLGTHLTLAFSRTWSWQYDLPLVHD